MKHILKVASLQNLPSTRPLIAMDENGNLFGAGEVLVPEGFIDFGLPSGTLWYSKNLGATNGQTVASWYGDYYAWGETETKNYYSWETYEHANGAANKLTKYCNNSKYGNDGYTDELTELVSIDDVAVSLGWKMPTKAQFEELLAETLSSWQENYQGIEGLNGRLLTKSTITQQAFKNVTLYGAMFGGELTDVIWNNLKGYTLEEINALFGGQDIRTMIFKDAEYTVPAVYGTDYSFAIKQTDPSVSMFIPAAGWYIGSSSSNAGSYGYYQSSSLYLDIPSAAWCVNFSSGGINMYNHDRFYGHPIRPVLQN